MTGALRTVRRERISASLAKVSWRSASSVSCRFVLEEARPEGGFFVLLLLLLPLTTDRLLSFASTCFAFLSRGRLIEVLRAVL